MDWRREDRIYDLQQALAAIPRQQWAAHLDTWCAGDPALRQEVMERQRQTERKPLDSPAGFCSEGGAGERPEARVGLKYAALMDRGREDRNYELQQALAQMLPKEWASYLDAACRQTRR